METRKILKKTEGRQTLVENLSLVSYQPQDLQELKKDLIFCLPGISATIEIVFSVLKHVGLCESTGESRLVESLTVSQN